VERIVLFGSQTTGDADEESDIDLAVLSEAFGLADHREFSGVLSEAKWGVRPATEAAGFHP